MDMSRKRKGDTTVLRQWQGEGKHSSMVVRVWGERPLRSRLPTLGRRRTTMTRSRRTLTATMGASGVAATSPTGTNCRTVTATTAAIAATTCLQETAGCSSTYPAGAGPLTAAQADSYPDCRCWRRVPTSSPCFGRCREHHESARGFYHEDLTTRRHLHHACLC